MLTLKMALKSIGSNKLRAFLTMLGIIIGVMALVILVSLVNGATGSVTESISSLGSNMLTISVSDNKGAPVTLDDLNAWMTDGIAGNAAAYEQESFTGKYGGNSATVDVYGVSSCYDDIQALNVLLGRFIKTTDVDNHTYVAVINEGLASELVGYTDCIGEEITIGGTKFTVIGIIEDDDSSLTRVFSGDSLVAYIPYTSLVRMSGSATLEVTSFYVSAPENVTTEATETAMEQLLLERFEEDDDAFSIISTDALEDAMSSVTSALAVLLGGIAAISLIVGGIGIKNIMLVTVTE